jgi:hypothetical protein
MSFEAPPPPPPGPSEGYGQPQPNTGFPPPPPAGSYGTPPPPAAYGTGQPPVGYGTSGHIGKIRPTGLRIFYFIISLGVYGLYWYYQAFEDMKRHKGVGLGGVVGLVLAVIPLVNIAVPFLVSDEIGKLYESSGREAPVSALTALWLFLPFVGGIVWFVKVNGALNEYWASQGAVA